MQISLLHLVSGYSNLRKLPFFKKSPTLALQSKAYDALVLSDFVVFNVEFHRRSNTLSRGNCELETWPNITGNSAINMPQILVSTCTNS